MRYLLLFIMGLIVGATVATGQDSIRPLNTGDKVPDILFRTVLNHNKPTARLSEFRSRLLIIDVWDRGCGICIAKFPEMEALQEKYKNDLRVILLTRNDLETFNKARESSKIVRDTKLPMIIGDSLIGKLFPYVSVPLHIWIDSTGRVIDQTNYYSTNTVNIDKYFKGEKLEMLSRKNSLATVDFNEFSILSTNDSTKGRPSTYSVFTSSLRNFFGYRGDAWVNEKNQVVGMKYLNASLPALLTAAFDTPVELSFAGSEDFVEPGKDDVREDYFRQYVFCYESKVPPQLYDSADVIKRMFQRDILDHFNLKIRESYKVVEEFELVQTGNIDFIKNKGKLDASKRKVDSEYKVYECSSCGLLSLAAWLSTVLPGVVTNAINYDGAINIKIDLGKHPDIISINRDLKQYNLAIKPIERTIKIHVAYRNGI